MPSTVELTTVAIPPRRLSGSLTVLGAASAVLYATVVPVADAYYGIPPIAGGAMLYPAVFLLYFAALYVVWRHRTFTPSLRQAAALALGGGIAFRALMLCNPVPPNQDLWRYLWEGRVLLAGKNTFAAPPESPVYDSIRAELRAESNPLWERLCPPPTADLDPYSLWAARTLCGIRSTYGPVASAVFAIADLLPLDPILALRLVMTLFDVGACVLLLLTLARLGRNPLWALVYCWSPLCLNSFADRAQLDGVFVFLLALSAWLLVSKRPAWAGVALGLALGVKISPAFVALPFMRQGRRGFILAFAVTAALMFAPMVVPGSAGWSGLVAMAKWWRGEDSVYTILVAALQPFLATAADHTARASLAVAAFAYALWRTFRTRPTEPQWALENAACILAAGLLLSPVVYPWYATGMVAFLCFMPSPGLLLLTAGLMAWYLGFLRPWCEALPWWPTEFARRYQDPWRWLFYVPVYSLLVWEAARRRALRERAQ